MCCCRGDLSVLEDVVGVMASILQAREMSIYAAQNHDSLLVFRFLAYYLIKAFVEDV